MWIRSQNKLHLVNSNDICVFYKHLHSKDILLGEYKTEERALQVLDEIQEKIINHHNGSLSINVEPQIQTSCGYAVYEMPKE